MIIIRIILLFILLVLLLRLKVPFFLSILLVGIVLGIGFGLNLNEIGQASLQIIRQPETITLIVTVGLILIFSELLGESGHLASLNQNILTTLGRHRLTLIFSPALIGLLPMPGGALFSAPMVAGVSNRIEVKQHQKTLINYWFRHIWEYGWPLYPGLILAAKLSDTPLFTFSTCLLPLTVAAVVSGIIFLLSGITISRPEPPNGSIPNFLRLFYLVFPLLLIVVLFLVLHLPIWLCLLIATGWVVINNLWGKKLTIKQSVIITFGRIKTYQMMLMVAGVLVFVGILQASKLNYELAEFFHCQSSGEGQFWYNLGAIVFFPFIIGLLTGLTIAFVGTTFPITLSSFIPAHQPVLPFMLMAYASGLAGVMLSPTHLCLILSNRYFGSSLKKVYQYLVPMTALVLLTAGGLLWFYRNYLAG